MPPSKRNKKGIDFLARGDHYIDHVQSIWHEIPEEERGSFYTRPEYFPYLSSFGIKGRDAMEITRMDSGPLTFTVSHLDMKFSRDNNRKTVIGEHGCGFTYSTRSNSYINGLDRAGVVGIFVPAELQAEISREAHPCIPVYPIGAPKLDPFFPDPPPGPKRTVAFSTHWDCKVSPFTRSTIRHYRTSLPLLKKNFDFYGHSHPRFRKYMQGLYAKYSIPFLETFDEVIEKAHVYICDSSSTMYEWAALDRPVVVLNAPWYPKDREENFRFWSMADVGIQVDNPKDLIAAVKMALQDPPEIKARRREIAEAVYGPRDGKSSERAAQALRELADHWN